LGRGWKYAVLENFFRYLQGRSAGKRGKKRKKSLLKKKDIAQKEKKLTAVGLWLPRAENPNWWRAQDNGNPRARVLPEKSSKKIGKTQFKSKGWTRTGNIGREKKKGGSENRSSVGGKGVQGKRISYWFHHCRNDGTRELKKCP